MCVILICPGGVRPDRPTLEACHEANPHGAGVAWRQDGGVRWLKGLDVPRLASLLPRLPGEVVVHFRWASVGDVAPALCHPFPVTRAATPGTPDMHSPTTQTIAFSCSIRTSPHSFSSSAAAARFAPSGTVRLMDTSEVAIIWISMACLLQI